MGSSSTAPGERNTGKILTVRSLLVVALLVGAVCAAIGVGGEGEIIDDIERYFSSNSLNTRGEIIARIEADPAYDPKNLSALLHRARVFEAPDATGGIDEFSVPLEHGESRTVSARIPANYDAATAWPMIYALHGTGGNAKSIIQYFERLLGERIEQFVVVAPNDYEQVVIHSAGDPSDEHLRVLSEARKRLHLDSDRIYCAGYSRGGHTAWTLAILHADEFASVLSLAGTFNLMGVDQLWEPFLPNIQHLPVYHVWGAHDDGGHSGLASPEGGIAGVSRLLRDRVEALKLPVTCYEYPERGHDNIVPPPEILDRWLKHERVHDPKTLQKTFRWPYQASAYWIKGEDWTGNHWDEKPFTVQPRKDESALDAYHRAIRARLGNLEATVEGQTVDIRRKKLRSAVIWIGDDLIDWDHPVAIRVSGREYFEGMLTRDLDLCLMQARRTRDFDRLRWSGVIFRSGKRPEVIQAQTEFPRGWDVTR
ncbi:MAG: alpha/beta hydrolase-fold protein [Phycisphaerae bacterium]